MNIQIKKVGLFILAMVGAILAFLVGKSVTKSVAKTQVRLPIRVNIPANVRDISRASNLNELVSEFTE